MATIETDNHQLIADEPIDEGGTNKGPAPTRLLCASLASCKAITAKLYAQRKGWQLDLIEVKVTYKVQKWEEPDGTNQVSYVFDSVYQLEGELDAEQKQRTMIIAERCPVSRILKAGVTGSAKLVN